jgi:hypothetical protein
MGAITSLYQTRHVQTYGGLKELGFKLESATAADTINLAAFTGVSTTNKAYKNTKAVVDAATAKDYDMALKIDGVTTAKIRFAYAINVDTGAWVPIVASSTATLTVGAGPSSSDVEVVVLYK